MMKIVDLTHTIHKEILVYPGTTGPEIDVPFTVEKDGFQETALSIWSHVGTHMDAPGHMVSGGLYLDQMPVEAFTGKAIKIPLTNEMTLEKIKEYESQLPDIDFVILETGYDKKFVSKDYFEDFPVLPVSVTEYLMTFSLKGIGVDAISVDPVGSTDMPNHMVIFEKNCVIIENLKGLDQLPETFKFYALPLNFENSDGAPVRAIAEACDET